MADEVVGQIEEHPKRRKRSPRKVSQPVSEEWDVDESPDPLPAEQKSEVVREPQSDVVSAREGLPLCRRRG